MKNKIFLIILGMILLIGIVSASSFGYNSASGASVSVGGSVNNNYTVYNMSGNTTQFINVGSLVTLQESWLSTFLGNYITQALIQALGFYTTSQIDTNINGNISSLNSTLSNRINDVNTSLTTKINSISGGNASFNQSLTNTLYYGINNPSNFVNGTYAPNTTAGIQALINSTGIYTFNSTLNIQNLYNSTASIIANTSINQYLNSTISQNANNFWNWTSYTNCSAGQFAVNFSKGGFQCSAISTTAGTNGTNGINGTNGLNGSVDYSNVMMTNQTNGINITQFLFTIQKLTLNEGWLGSFLSSNITQSFIQNLGFYTTTDTYNKSQVDTNLSLRYSASNPSNFWNWTSYTNCTTGQYAVNFTKAGFQCLTPAVSLTNYFDQQLNTTSNVAFTNITNQNTIYAGNITYYANGCYRLINATGIYDIC